MSFNFKSFTRVFVLSALTVFVLSACSNGEFRGSTQTVQIDGLSKTTI